MRRLLTAAAGAALMAAALAGSTAVAAPGAAAPPPPVPSLLVTGTLDAGTKAKQDGIRLATRDDAVVRNFTLTYPVGSKSGWHRHPGIVLATVEKGAVVQQVGCRRNVWTAGQSFTEVEPHQVENLVTTGSEEDGEARLQITQIVPAGRADDVRDEADPPRCRKPRR